MHVLSEGEKEIERSSIPTFKELYMIQKSLMTLAIISLTATPAYATTNVTLKTFTTISQKGALNPAQAIFITTPATTSLDVFAWTVLTRSWSEAIGGITYSPTTWFQILLGVGAEQDVHPLRGYAGVWIGSGNVSLLAEAELGGSGWWYQSIGSHRVTDWLKLGYTARRLEGVGPRLEISIPKTPFTVWGTPYIVEPESRATFPGAIVGVTTHL